MDAVAEMQEGQIRDGDDERIQLEPSVTSADSRSLWISWILYGFALALWLWLARSTAAWIVGSAIAAFGGGMLLADLGKWFKARPLGKALGKLVLTVDRLPARIGEPLGIRIAQRVRSPIHLRAMTVRLHCAAARIRTYGIRDRKQKTWSNALDVEVLSRGDALLEASEVLTAEGRTVIPSDEHESSDWTTWWLVVEVFSGDGPPYSATFPLQVVSRDDAAGAS